MDLEENGRKMKKIVRDFEEGIKIKISYIRYEIDTDGDRSIRAQLLKIDEKSEKETSVLGKKKKQ